MKRPRRKREGAGRRRRLLIKTTYKMNGMYVDFFDWFSPDDGPDARARYLMAMAERREFLMHHFRERLRKRRLMQMGVVLTDASDSI